MGESVGSRAGRSKEGIDFKALDDELEKFRQRKQRFQKEKEEAERWTRSH